MPDNTARRPSTLGDIQPSAPVVGTIYNTVESWHVPAHSFNPRRFADSRRKWARLVQEKFNQIPPAGFLTTTLSSDAHGQITCGTVAAEARSHRALKQKIDRWLCSVVKGRCVECVRTTRPCKGAHHRAARWYPTGRCAQCGNWRRLEWQAARWVWLCSKCQVKPSVSLKKRDRKPSASLSWVREVGKSSQHLHRHSKITGPFIPQDLLSRWAEESGLGKVLDIRADSGPGARRGGLDTYLAKQAKTQALPPSAGGQDWLAPILFT